VSEITDVLDALERLRDDDQRMALATIVAVRGSTYRRPGARLLVPEQGAPIGNISGGCLEGDVADMARVVMRDGASRLAAWDLTADDDEVWGLGLGCNGAIEVFIEPADRAVAVTEALREALDEERPISVITALGSDASGVEPGARLAVRPDGSVQGSLGDEGIDGEATIAANELLAAGRSEIRMFARQTRAFVEVLEPPLRLVICGAGHDAISLVRAAAGIGWRPVIVDDRSPLLTLERFPEAHAFVHVDAPQDVDGRAALDERTCAVVMTHNYLRDRDYLRGLLRSDASYIGMLGPAARTQRILLDLAADGVEVTDGDRARIHGPAGLDVGAEGPDEVAHAIIAEILAVRHHRQGGLLRERPGPIHDRPRPGTEARQG
jgi:xanthine dehydrogenase accessory factor